MSSATGARGALLAVVIVAVLSALPTAITLDDDCTYTIYTRTGSIWRAETYSKITVTLYDDKGTAIEIPDLSEWDKLRGPHHTPFQNGALDTFSGLHYCLKSPVCAINITSDGEKSNSGWYLDYLEVTSTGAHLPCNQKAFEVERWIAYDTWPFSLVYTQDDCKKKVLDQPIEPHRRDIS